MDTFRRNFYNEKDLRKSLMKNFFTKNPLFFAFLFPAAVDGIITLIGQGSQYWQASNKVVNEASPAYFFLAASPWLFILGSAIWFLGWYWIFLKLSEKWKLFFVFLFISAHSWGSGSWFVKLAKDKGVWSLNNILLTNFFWGLLIFYFVIIAFLALYCLTFYLQKERNEGSRQTHDFE